MGKRGEKRHHPYERKGAVVKSNKGLASCSQSHKSGEDRISKLPVDILVAILSLLTIKEAGRSSVLSHRWRYLWTFFTGKLEIGCKDRSRETRVVERLSDFQTCLEYKHNMLDMFELDNVITYFGLHGMLASQGRVARNVNKVLKSHRGLFLEELKIYFAYWDKFSCIVDNWVKLASEKDIRSFKLDLERDREPGSFVTSVKCYEFPSARRLFTSLNPAHRNFSSLTCLSLRHVNVCGKVLKHFLVNCNLLKQLRVIRSETLKKLNVTGPSLKLELLEVSDCWSLKVLNISAKNLVSLKYVGPSQHLFLYNVPLLSQMSIAGNILSSLEKKSCRHFRSIQQLESLKVQMNYEACRIQPKFRPQFPQMPCLKQLELDIQSTFGNDLVFYACLIKSFPLLHRLAMRYSYSHKSYFDTESDADGEKPSTYKQRLEKTDKTSIVVTADFQHQSLKVVEVVGFVGYETDLELVFTLVEVAVSLEKLIIEPCKFFKFFESESRRRARKLEQKLPPYVNLLVL